MFGVCCSAFGMCLCGVWGVNEMRLGMSGVSHVCLEYIWGVYGVCCGCVW